MKITAEGARRSVYIHDVADEELETIQTLPNGNLRFRIQTEEDPGIGAGLYNLNITFSREEIMKLYEKAIVSKHEAALKVLQKRVNKLERKLK